MCRTSGEAGTKRTLTNHSMASVIMKNSTVNRVSPVNLHGFLQEKEGLQVKMELENYL